MVHGQIFLKGKESGVGGGGVGLKPFLFHFFNVDHFYI